MMMDYRENDSGVGQILAQKYGVALTTTALKTGDYMISDQIVIERKTTLDFVQSIIDGRLFKQTAQMKRNFDCAAVIVEGKNPYETSIGIHPHAVKGALISIASRWQIPVLFSDDSEDTALLLWIMTNQNEITNHEWSYRPGRRPKRIFKRQLCILQGLPQVGPALAVKLLDYFGSAEKVMTASEEALMQIPRLGPIKAQKIREIISTCLANPDLY